MMRSGPSAGTTRCVRDGLGGNEWVLLISFPDNIGGNPSVPQVTNYRPSKSADALGDGLRGWACRIRTKESVREPPNWICVTISPKVGASLRQRPVAYELRYTDLLRPIQQAILARRAALYFPLPLPAGDPQFFSVSRRRLKNSPSTPLFVRRFTARKPSCGTLGACCTIQPQILTLF